MRLKFTVQATAYSTSALTSKINGMRQFPASVINRVIVCNRDGCSHQHITNVKDGKFDVDFDLVPESQGAALCDTLKFHFYTGNSIPIVVAAGGVSMDSIIKLMAHSPLKPQTFQCNFGPVYVHAVFLPPPEPITTQIPYQLEKSTLANTQMAMGIASQVSTELSNLIANTLDIKTTCGAPMFCSLLTAHNMQDEATTHAHFQSDVTPTYADSERFYVSGLTMTALAETLHTMCLTADQVLAMDPSSDNFSMFVSSACQSYMRSAHICPYVSDKVLSPDLDCAGQIKHMLSESFKLPLREPFMVDENVSGFLNADDCEGHATFMLYLFKSFQHLHEKYKDNRSANHIAFPAHLFDMTSEEKLKLWDIAMKIGEMAVQQKLRCDITLISAGSAALGDGGDQIGGHATCVLVNASNPEQPKDFLMEGTNSMTWDDDQRSIMLIKEGLVPISVPLVQVANMLTDNISKLLGEAPEPDTRKLTHLNTQLENKFYKTAFCQYGVLLATKGGSDDKLFYGINMDHISDYTKKVLMPISNELINKVTKNNNASKILTSHYEARKSEIHPPPAHIEKIAKALKQWSPVNAYADAEALRGRQYKVCVAMRSCRSPSERLVIYNATREKLEEWNKKYCDIGYCSAYTAFDTVFTRLCMWTDNLPKLQESLSKAMTVNKP